MPPAYSSVYGRRYPGSTDVVVPEVMTGKPVCSPGWKMRSRFASFHVYCAWYVKFGFTLSSGNPVVEMV